VRRAHPPSHISLDGLAVTTHWSCPQAPGCTNERGDNFPETGGVGFLHGIHGLYREQMGSLTPTYAFSACYY
jgi:hypothetical protein